MIDLKAVLCCSLYSITRLNYRITKGAHELGARLVDPAGLQNLLSLTYWYRLAQSTCTIDRSHATHFWVLLVSFLSRYHSATHSGLEDRIFTFQSTCILTLVASFPLKAAFALAKTLPTVPTVLFWEPLLPWWDVAMPVMPAPLFFTPRVISHTHRLYLRFLRCYFENSSFHIWHLRQKFAPFYLNNVWDLWEFH
jgi:hypothetical protein